jgi:hypothetical protein
MIRSMTLLCLWDFCCIYTMELRNRLVRPLPQLNGRTPIEVLTGNTPDISEFLEFEWYQPVWFYEPDVFPRQNKQLARWLGVAHRVGQAMCFWMLPVSGIPIARTTIQSLTPAVLQKENIKQLLLAYDSEINTKLNLQTDANIPTIEGFKLYKEDKEADDDNNDQELLEPESAFPDMDEISSQDFDESIKAKIVGRKRNKNGELIGRFNPNPLLNSGIYLAEFPDGHIRELGANAVVEAIYDNIDDRGYETQIFQGMLDIALIQR